MSGLGDRDAAIEALARATGDHPLDVLVVGGGITGAGIALDAVSRGMNVGLAERADFASGTSSKSSKLVHGGLRYLEQREFGLVREASVERAILGRLAPHLVRPMPFVIPVSNRWMRARFGVGLWAYDALATFRNINVHRYLSAEETEKLVPPLPMGKVRGGFSFYDSKTDDVRLVMENLIQATRLGAVVANYLEVTAIEAGAGACSVEVVDRVGGHRFEVRARRVLVAAGVWSEHIDRMVGSDESSVTLQPSKGVHVVLRKETLPMGTAAAFIPDAERRRMLFVIPWLDAVIVGTTDERYDGALDRPTVEPADLDYCLAAVEAAFGVDVPRDEVAGAYAGLRPLVRGRRGETTDLSRKHAIYRIAPGVVAITGGKLTTYRRMAADAVDAIAGEIDVGKRSRTRWVRLGSSNLDVLRTAVLARSRRLGLNEARAEHLIASYGDRALEVLDLAARVGTVDPIAPGHLPIVAEAAYTARAEMVQDVSDFLARRTRLALTDPAAGIGADSAAPQAVADALGWDASETAARVARYRAEVERERGMPLGEQLASQGRAPARSG